MFFFSNLTLLPFLFFIFVMEYGADFFFYISNFTLWTILFSLRHGLSIRLGLVLTIILAYTLTSFLLSLSFLSVLYSFCFPWIIPPSTITPTAAFLSLSLLLSSPLSSFPRICKIVYLLPHPPSHPNFFLCLVTYLTFFSSHRNLIDFTGL